MKFRSISSRIILSVVPVVALFTLVYVVMIYSAMGRQIDVQINERMLENLRAAKLSINAELYANADVARHLAIYAETASLASIEAGELNQFLLKAISGNKNTVGGGIWFEPHSLYPERQYFGPYVYVKDGEAFLVSEYSNEVDYHHEPWYINGKRSAGEIVWSNVYYDPVADVTMVTATMPFYGRDGKFLGVTTADMALTNIKNISSSIVVGETGKAFILGANGEFISFLDESRSIGNLVTMDSNSELAALGKKVLLSTSGSSGLFWEGKKFLAFFDFISESTWHVVAMIENQELGESINELVIPLAVVAVGGLLIIIASIILVTRSLTRVADKVNRFAIKAASGDLSERIVITEHDEFGTMEETLNAMMNNMAEISDQSRKMLADAQAANRAKTDFLSNMSHEMRTPMNAILGMVNIAQQTEDTGRIQTCLDKISYASKSLLMLINDVLDMAKIEANKIEMEIQRFSLRVVLEGITDIFTYKAEEKHLVLSTKVDSAIPEHLWSDAFRYSQIVTNMLGNAMKFTPDGGTIEIIADLTEKTETTVTIQTSVKDSGIGISPEAEAKLFRSFEQADSSISRKYGGTGLGLSISKRLAELLGGTIWFKRNEDKGSSFIFTIVAETSGKEESVKSTRPEHEKRSFKGKRLLLVEDVEINREIVTAFLEPTEISIDYAENGLIACKKFADNPDRYDLIFMDIQMPEMDGLTATRKIRGMESGRHIPIVAMSANAFKEDIDACISAGMDRHLAKPLDPTDLLELLNLVLEK